jgi:sigma-B regulation protein RsbU (phosphoserine phosphatase)
MLKVRSPRILVCLLTLLLVAASASARVDKPHPPVDPHNVTASLINGPIDLSSTWLVRNGDDDPHYADPHFDDSQWPVIKSGRPFNFHQIVKDSHVVWYRTHAHVPPGTQDLTLLLRHFEGNWKIFVNGVEVTSFGPNNQDKVVQAEAGGVDRLVAIPASVLGTGDVTIAFRDGDFALSSLHPGVSRVVLLGPQPVLEEYAAIFSFRSLTPGVANVALELLIFVIALALAATLRDEREYLALTLFFALSLGVALLGVWSTAANNHVAFEQFGKDAFEFASLLALCEFLRLVLGMRRGRWFKIFEWALGGGAAAMVFVPFLNLIHRPEFLALGLTILLAIIEVPAAIAFVLAGVTLPFAALWLGWKRHNPDAMLLSIPLLLQPAVIITSFISLILSHGGDFPKPHIQAFYLDYFDVTEFLLNLAMLLFLIRRTVRIARSRAAMATDLQAVQSVQEILLSRASHDTPGFLVEHVYYPASEVGGDFFLVSPGPDGAITAVVGDVSGKGLVAAMRVAMILGVLRREEQREPEAVLRNLNEALMMQGEMGFTTACCVRLEPDGRYTLANAGHINPYIGGVEIPTPPSLPLGMDEDQVYEQVSGVLPAGKTLVLMSDGVVEARSPKGELYGFDRLPALTMMSAGDIADVARRFGQEDDITVLTLAFA